MEPLVVIGVVVLIGLIWLIAVYNRFVRLKHAVKESWAGIDVELKRRYELIPNLVATVKGYARHERELLERVVELRNQAEGNRGSADSQGRSENALQVGLRSLFAVAEGYPELKSDRQFLALQEELGITEDRIAAARRFFNGNVRDLKNMKEQFPTSLVGGMVSDADTSYFELDEDSERVVPRVTV